MGFWGQKEEGRQKPIACPRTLAGSASGWLQCVGFCFAWDLALDTNSKPILLRGRVLPQLREPLGDLFAFSRFSFVWANPRLKDHTFSQRFGRTGRATTSPL